jgi:uncharacterized repeat protein (TIGR01451 family)
VFTTTLPSGLTLVSDTTGLTPTNPSEGVYAWELGDLADRAEIKFKMYLQSTATLNDGDSLSIQGELTAAIAPGDKLANNSTTAIVRFYSPHTIVPILDARTATSGVFTVEGHVTMKPGSVSAPEWVLQDETGGIAVYDGAKIPALSLGDFVRVRGTRSQFNNQEQLISVVFVDVVSPGEPVAPRDVTTGELASGSTEGWLVRLVGVVEQMPASCTSNHTIVVNDGSGPANVYVASTTKADACAMGVKVGSPVRITGFSSQYSDSYQLKVRQPADIVLDEPQISKTAPVLVLPGEIFTYTLTVRNNVGFDLTSLVISDTIPANSTHVSGGNYMEDGVVYWEVPLLANGGSLSRQLTVQAAPDLDTKVTNHTYGVTTTEYPEPVFGTPVTTYISDRLRIRHIQGEGALSPLNGQPVENISGVVTGLHNNGFFIQDPQPDEDWLTSEGVFVLASTTGIVPGTLITVTQATVSENGLLTSLTSVTLTQGPGGFVITPTQVSLPVDTDLEPFESMLVTFTQTLTVSQNYFLGRYGQLTLSGQGRMYNPNNGNGLGDTLEYNLRRMIVLDDNTEEQNPTTVPYLGLDPWELRAGFTLESLTGVVDYGIINSSGARYYRLQPTLAPVFIPGSTRTPSPDPIEGRLRIASFNVLNYFNGNGLGGGFPTTRGASTDVEFTRQRAKIILAILALDADVIGLMEMENDGTGPNSALQDLVNGLNENTAPSTYALVSETAPGTDEIKVSLIYRPAAVTPLGAALNYQVTTHPTYSPLYDRPPLAQLFTENLTGEVFSVVVNHFKSKSSCPSSPTSPDADKGQGCWNARRTAQANGLLDLLAQLEALDPDVFVIGDLNAYAKEDPVLALEAGGLFNEAERWIPAAENYSYVFDGMAGSLDHALSTSTAYEQVSGATIWHINTDEPAVLDYNMEFNGSPYYATNPYRSSDHDPALLGVDLGWSVSFEHSSPVNIGETMVFTNTSQALSGCSWDFGDGSTSTDFHPTHQYAVPGVYMVTLTGYHGQAEPKSVIAAVTVQHELLVSIDGPELLYLGETAVFTSTVSGLPPYTYTWDFGDNTTSSEPNPQHVYAEAGEYTVGLLVSDLFFERYVSAQLVVIDALEASFKSNSPVLLGETMTFTSTVSGSGEYSCAWDFGDEQVSSEVDPVHLYESAGDYLVWLAVENEYETVVVSGTVTVLERLLASFESNSPVLLGEAAVFTSTVSGPGAYSYTWAFGDNSTSSAPNPQHTYTAAGSYLVSLEVDNGYERVMVEQPFLVLTPSTLVVTKTVSSEGAVDLGQPVTYSITFANTGDEILGEVSLEDVLPAALGWVDWVKQIEGMTVEDGVIRWTGSLPARSTLNFSYTGSVRVDLALHGTQVVNTVTVSTAGLPAAVASASFSVMEQPELSILKTVLPTTGLKPGDDLVYTIQVSNPGPAAALGVRITDVMPEGVAAANVDVTIDIPAGQTHTITVPAKVAAGVAPGAQVTNTASCTYGTQTGSASATFSVASPTTFRLFLPAVMRAQQP